MRPIALAMGIVFTIMGIMSYYTMQDFMKVVRTLQIMLEH